jgi:hypothetical protein
MKKLVLITSIVIANLLIAAESRGQNSVYIISEVTMALSSFNFDSVYVTSPTGAVTGYQIPRRSNVAGHEAAFNVIINGVTSLGYTITDHTIAYGYSGVSGQNGVVRWILQKP